MQELRSLSEVLRKDAYRKLTPQQTLDVCRVLNGDGKKQASMAQLAEWIGVTQAHLSRVYSGERPVAGQVEEFLRRISED